MSHRLVYSTESGRLCPNCHKPVDSCSCKPGNKKTASSQEPQDGVVRIRREIKGRKGKGVTLITGLPQDNPEPLKKLIRTLKQRCSTGGAIKEGIVELQGDHRDTVLRYLEEQGFNCKLAGG